MEIKSRITESIVAKYVLEKIVTEPDLDSRLRAETHKLPNAQMISSADVGRFLQIMALAMNAKKAIEIGTFTGYTALQIARALPDSGKLICCDINADWTAIGKKFWDEAGVAGKIDLVLAPAAETIQGLINSGQEATFDFAFIDADKLGYAKYYELCLRLIRPGGLIVLDNMLWDGDVARPEVQDKMTNAIRDLNFKISKDDRVNSCLLTLGDGLMLAYKK